ncbi:MAG: hypothetical protein AB1634_14015 [Thermodesulfobacteriota bacterium]
MKKVIFIGLLALTPFVASTSSADTEGSATAHVYMDVVANIAVAPETPVVDAGDIQMGDFSATFQFRIDANTEAVQMFMAASDLWKGDDPLGTAVAPIPVNLSEGVVFDCDNANPLQGAGDTAAFTAAMVDINGFPAVMSEPIAFESSQNGHFSQSCRQVVTWSQNDPEKPMGEYSGKVRLTAMVLP